jgi:hypothetical protein
MGVLVIAGQARFGLVERQFREQRHPIEGLLAVGNDVIAERLDLQPRERLVDAFDFLKADDIGRAFLQPGQQMLEPLPDRIDVPGGNTHARGSGLGSRCPGEPPGFS